MEKTVLIVATKNKGKMREIRDICTDIPVTLRSLEDIWPGINNLPETGSTFQENAAMKAAWVFSRKKTWTLADDSGLEVDALGGEPGVFSSRYAGEPADDTKNMSKLLQNLANVEFPLRTARFRCVLVMKGPGVKDIVVCGVCEGHIAFEPRGTAGFGYDPVFVPRGYEKTFAEIDPAVKNRMSHRALALQALKKELGEHFPQ